jgi:hypothetical protein
MLQFEFNKTQELIFTVTHKGTWFTGREKKKWSLDRHNIILAVFITPNQESNWQYWKLFNDHKLIKEEKNDKVYKRSLIWPQAFFLATTVVTLR